MIGEVIRCKYPYSFNNIGQQLDEAFTPIQLKEPQFEMGYFIKGIDIRYFDLFETDIDYDNRKDLKKFGTRMKQYGFQSTNIIKTNLYGYIGTDYPEKFKFR